MWMWDNMDATKVCFLVLTLKKSGAASNVVSSLCHMKRALRGSVPLCDDVPPPLHPMERGPGGEAANSTPRNNSGSPSPLVERGLGGAVRTAVARDCFRAGTLIKAREGWRPIETIRAG